MMPARKQDEQEREQEREQEKQDKQQAKQEKEMEKLQEQKEKEEQEQAKEDKEQLKLHHDEAGNVIPGHEGSSEIATAIAEAEARARTVALPPNVGDGQPGIQNVVAQVTSAPIKVDGRNRRSDHDALEGHFAQVAHGDSEYDGRIGSFESVVAYGEDGYPTEVLFRTRDSASELLSIPYDHLHPMPEYHGGR